MSNRAGHHEPPGILTVLSVASMQGNRLQIKAAIKVDSGHDVPLIVQHKYHKQSTAQTQISSLL